ncbi:MAG TPA: hypothetical protein VMV05_06790 [bacterium]|nr:hypothetical protein [bacterium]
MKYLLLSFLLAGLLTFASIACQSNFSTSALPATILTPSPTPTCYYPIQTLPCATGIMWNPAYIIYNNQGIASRGQAGVYLAVNCAPVTDAAVTVSGPGLNFGLQYDYPVTIGGVVYSWYTNVVSGVTFTAGAAYTLTTLTGAGTASAGLVMPNNPSFAADGSGATWTGPSLFNEVDVVSGAVTTFSTGTCWSVSSPFSIPSSAYPYSGNFAIFAKCLNSTQTIANGAGLFYALYQSVASVNR